MKKIIACLIIALLTMALVACNTPADDTPEDSAGKQEQSGAPSDDSTTPEDDTTPAGDESRGEENRDLPDFDDIFSGGSTDTVWGQADEATKQAILEAGRQSGMEITFGSDGSMTVSDPANGQTITQKPDGTWVISGEDGFEGQLGGGWPDNEFTKIIPKPDFTVTVAAVENGEFVVAFVEVAVEKVKAYAEQLQAAGYTLDPNVIDTSADGTTYYVYSASHENGYTVTVYYSGGACGMSMTKP